MISLEGIVVALALTVGTCDIPGIPNTYDQDIRRAVDQHWPVAERVYWCKLKAQFYEESRFVETAQSPVGAQGIAQVMPMTRDEIAQKLHLKNVNPFDAQLSIKMGAYYMAWVGERLTEPRDESCKKPIQQAAYNAGLGPFVKAQRLARKQGFAARCFDDVRGFLPAVMGPGSIEPCQYVDRIAYTHARLMRKKPTTVRDGQC